MKAGTLQGWTGLRAVHPSGHSIELGVGSNAGRFLLFNPEGSIVATGTDLSRLIRTLNRRLEKARHAA